MKWQKLLLFLAGSGAAFGYAALLYPTLIPPYPLTGLGLWITPRLFADWAGLPLPAGTLDPATCWIVCLALVIDLVYLVWLRRQRRARMRPLFGGDPVAQRHDLSGSAYAEALRQRHDALLARYQDPGLVQFLLNREAARAQHIDQWFEVRDELDDNAQIAAATTLKHSEPPPQQRVEPVALTMMVNPLGA